MELVVTSISVDQPTEPVQARRPCDIDLIIRVDEPLQSGDTIEWQFPHSWTAYQHGASYTKPLQATNPEQPHYVAVHADAAQFEIDIRERQLPDTHLRTRHGRHIIATITDGPIPADSPIRLTYANTTAPSVAGTEPIWLRIAGNEPETPPTITTIARDADSVRIIAPSSVPSNDEFNLRIVPLDEFDNPANREFENEALELTTGEIVTDDLAFSGPITLPVTISETGVHRFRFDDSYSNPIRVTESPTGPYWGDIHIHTGLSHDGQGRDPYGYARHISGLDFAATTEHIESIGEHGHQEVLTRAEKANDPGTFVTLPSYEHTLPAEYDNGHYNFYFRTVAAYREHIAEMDHNQPESDQRDTALIADPAAIEPTDRPTPDDLMVIPHHTGIAWGATGGATCSPTDLNGDDWCPAIEIYSHHGQSERYAPQHTLGYEFNRYRRSGRRINGSVPGPHYAQDFWTAGNRIGTIASSDEHTAMGGRATNGLAAVFAEELTRDGIFDGIRLRHTYGTTGERILLDFSVDGITMGDVGHRSAGDSLSISLDVWGTDKLLTVELLRYRPQLDTEFTPIKTEIPSGQASTTPRRSETFDTSVEVEDEIQAASIYYGRVTQAPVDRPAMAWTSPIWIETNDE